MMTMVRPLNCEGRGNTKESNENMRCYHNVLDVDQTCKTPSNMGKSLYGCSF